MLYIFSLVLSWLYYNRISICLGATTDNLDPGVLYQVKASYKYQAEDVDELNFEVGEVIDVVEYDDPEEQVLCLSYSAKYQKYYQ